MVTGFKFQSHRVRKGDFKTKGNCYHCRCVHLFQSHRVRKGDFKCGIFFTLIFYRVRVSISSSEKRGFKEVRIKTHYMGIIMAGDVSNSSSEKRGLRRD